LLIFLNAQNKIVVGSIPITSTRFFQSVCHTTFLSFFLNEELSCQLFSGMICIHSIAASFMTWFVRQQKTKNEKRKKCKQQVKCQVWQVCDFILPSVPSSNALATLEKERKMCIKSARSFNIHHHVHCAIVMKFIKLS
jgi:hypothetical protein